MKTHTEKRALNLHVFCVMNNSIEKVSLFLSNYALNILINQPDLSPIDHTGPAFITTFQTCPGAPACSGNTQWISSTVVSAIDDISAKRQGPRSSGGHGPL